MCMKQLVAVLGLSLGAASGAFGADSGFYVGGGGGSASYSGNIAGQIEDAYATTTAYNLSWARWEDDKDTAWKLFAGYRFGNGFGLELSRVDLGQVAIAYHVQVASPVQPSPTFLLDGRYDASAYGLSAFYEWEFNPKFSAIVRGGLFRSSLEYSQHSLTLFPYDAAGSNEDTVPGFGIGLNWRITPSFDMRLDYDRLNGLGERFAFEENTDGRFDVGTASLNLAWRFGR